MTAFFLPFVALFWTVLLFVQPGFTQDFFSQSGITLIASSERTADLQISKTKVSLTAQRKQNLLLQPLQTPETRMPQPGKFILLSEDFETNLADKDWQITGSEFSPDWYRFPANPYSGCFSMWCGIPTGSQGEGARPQYSDRSLSWLISTPLDLSDVESAAVRFNFWLQTERDHDILFVGVSTDAAEFYGYALSGDSNGWRHMNFDLNAVPELGKIPGTASVRLGFLFASDDSVTGMGAFLDDVRIVRDQGWRQETGAFIDGVWQDNAFSGGIGLARPAFVDIDNDGDSDLFVGEYDGTLNFYRNEGDRTKPAWHFVTDRYGEIRVEESSAPAFCDVDADGDPDLFIGDAEGTITFFRNIGLTGKPVWQRIGKLLDSAGHVIDVGAISTPAFSDIDADGDPDLVIGNADGFLAYYRNDSGTWTQVSKTYLGVDVGHLSAPAFADIDGDGREDLFTGIRENTLFFYRNEKNKKPQFSLVTEAFDSLEVGALTAPAFVDLDADGDLDLCIGQADGTLHFFRNDGGPRQWQFTPFEEEFDPQTVQVGFQCAPALVDLDADGDLDLVLGRDDGRFTLYRNEGDAQKPRWRSDSDLFDGVQTRDWSTPVFVDIDADGDLDLFSGSKLGKIFYFENRGDRSRPDWQFVWDKYDSLTFSRLTFPGFFDVDGDGDKDMLIGTETSGLSLYENVGMPHKPEWRPKTKNWKQLNYIRRIVPVFADIDMDGDADLFAGSHSGSVGFFENIGTAERPDWRLRSPGYNDIKVRFFSVPTFGDIDGDGDLDLFVGTNSGGVYFWRNVMGEPSFITSGDPRDPDAFISRIVLDTLFEK